MSGLFAVLLPRDDDAWFNQLDRLIKRCEARGHDGIGIATLSPEGFTKLSYRDKLYRRAENGGKYMPYMAFLGCAYSKPISLTEGDAGPFVSEKGELSLAYDGVVTGYTGQELVDWLAKAGDDEDWSGLVDTLEGQFAIIAMYRHRPDRIYYAVKAKPLHYLFDSIGRGILMASDREAFNGMYHSSRNPRPVEIKPYTAGYLTREGALYEVKSLINFAGEGTLVLSGGGLDTVVAAFSAKRRFPGERMELVYVNYGAKAHWQEYYATEAITGEISRRYRNSPTTSRRIEFPLFPQIAASNLTDWNRPVNTAPRAGKASEWVPARNTVLLTLAFAIAESGGFARIVLGINQDAATAYPDNDFAWLERMQRVVPYALGTDRSVQLVAPLGMMSKVEIVQHGEGLKIPWDRARSWSCYLGGEKHCGLCSSCRARRKAFVLASVNDVTEYAE